MTTPKIDTQKRSFFQDRKMWFWIAAGAGLLTVAMLVIFLQSLISTTKYYVLKTDVPARTLITTDMVQEQVVSSGGEPPTSLGLEDIQSQMLYSKASLSAGDILTPSNVGDLIPLRQGIPDDFVVTSFVADPNSSAGGNIKRGDYVDIFYVGDGAANLLLQRVLIMDTTTELSSGAAEDTSSEEEGTTTIQDDSVTAGFRGGIPALYTVGLTQDDALKLAAASEGKFYVVLTSATDIEKGATEKTLGMSLADALSSPARDSGAGTDRFFGQAKDENTENTNGQSAPAPTSSEPAISEDGESVVENESAPEVEETPVDESEIQLEGE